MLELECSAGVVLWASTREIGDSSALPAQERICHQRKGTTLAIERSPDARRIPPNQSLPTSKVLAQEDRRHLLHPRQRMARRGNTSSTSL